MLAGEELCEQFGYTRLKLGDVGPKVVKTPTTDPFNFSAAYYFTSLFDLTMFLRIGSYRQASILILKVNVQYSRDVATNLDWLGVYLGPRQSRYTCRFCDEVKVSKSTFLPIRSLHQLLCHSVCDSMSSSPSPPSPTMELHVSAALTSFISRYSRSSRSNSTSLSSNLPLLFTANSLRVFFGSTI